MLATISYHYHGNFYHKVVMMELDQVRYLWPEIPDRHPVYHEVYQLHLQLLKILLSGDQIHLIFNIYLSKIIYILQG